ncbi:MAG TPA: hypothetical protein DDW30_00175 [Clostridiales bacterium]|nr:hypothetical protein [Clostridiales bacterium]
MEMKTKEYSSALLREHYFEMRHPSGLPVYVFPKKLTTTYAILSTRYGAMDTSFRASDGNFITVPDGVAHFLEHKLFENPDGSDSFAKFSVWGADANAYTTANRTAYLFSCTEHFSEALEELLTFVTTPYFTPETVKKEQGIIAEEIRMYDDSPWDRCFQQLMEAMYAECGIRKNICGTERSIGEITDRLLYDCYRIFYQPCNMALVVCGDVTPEEVLAVCDRVLPQETIRLPIERAPFTEPDTVSRRRIEARMQVAKPLFTLGFKDPILPADPLARSRRYVAMNLLDEAIFSRAGALYSALFEEGLLTTSYSYSYSNTDRCAFHTVSGETDDPDAVEARIAAYLEQLVKTGIDADEIERARRVLYADELQSYDSTEEIANELLSYLFDGADLFGQPALIEDITADEVNALLPMLTRADLRCLSVIRPQEEPEKEEN